MTQTSSRIVLGRIVGVHGVRGWVKLHSDCRPREALLAHHFFFASRPKQDSQHPLTVVQSRVQGKSLVAKFDGIDDRDQAMTLIGLDLSVERSCLPDLPEGEYYWADLIGMQVINRADENLGQVAEIVETGANDVLIVRDGTQEHLIPFVLDHFIEQIDLKAREIRADWQTDWSQVSKADLESPDAD